MKNWDLLQHRGTLKTLRQVKEADTKGHMLYDFTYMK